MSKQEKFTLTSAQDGLALSVITELPETEPAALAVFAHGMAEHKERYLPFMEYLADNGIACIINDHRGHGESVKTEDDLGYFYDNGAQAVVEDLHQVLTWFKDKFPGKPVFLLGHSMGSLIVRVFTKKYDNEINGLVVSGCPSENPAAGPGKAIVGLIKVFKGEHYRSPFCDNLFNGSFNKGFENPWSGFMWLSYNEDNVKAYDDDKLCGFPFTLNGYKALLDLLTETYSHKDWQVKNKDLPVWFISGAEDPCMVSVPKFIAAVDTMRTVGYDDVTYKIYSNMRHEILNETDKQTVWDDVLAKFNDWIGSKR